MLRSNRSVSRYISSRIQAPEYISDDKDGEVRLPSRGASSSSGDSSPALHVPYSNNKQVRIPFMHSETDVLAPRWATY